MKPCIVSSVVLLGLATLVSAQVTPKVVIDRPAIASAGDEITFTCTMPDEMGSSDDTCHILRPDGDMVTVNFLTGDVKDENGDAVSGYEGVINDNRRVCGLTVNSVNTNRDLGQWSCKMNDDGSASAWRMGTFQVLTPEEGHLKEVRLPRHLFPYLHSVDLIPQLEPDYEVKGAMRLITKNFEYSEADEPYLDKVYLHAKNIDIDEDGVMVRTFTKDNTIIGHEYDLEREFYVIHLGEPLWTEAWDTYHLVNFTFTSYLSDDLRGFYRSTYNDENGDPVTIGSTQFQYIDARRAFPCLDEPDMKGRFQISLEHEENMIATSNMPILATVPGSQSGWVKDTFRLSEKMSSYLIAFLVSDFENTTTSDETFNIVHQPGKGNQASLAADAGPKILSFMEDYFNIPYPLPKVDMAAIPDFKYGAMENWGLITYRESALLFDENISTQSDRDRVIEVIAHELAHMWFGNLVTMRWWTDLWLNEGFATYVENIGKDYYDPALQSVDRTIIVDLHDVFGIDSLESSLPISVEVGNPEYDMTFSRLSYGKGNCLLRMIEHFITLDAFNLGIQTYLNNLAYDNADRSDLWAYLDAAAHVEGAIDSSLKIGEIMEGYTAFEGYPVVTVTGVQGMQIQLDQKRFFLSPEAPESDLSWFIPINYAYPGGDFDTTTAMNWMQGTGAPLTITVEEKPYVINIQQTGYYRVNYDADNWSALRSALMSDNTGINRLNRAQILDDSFNLARAGQLDYETPLEIAEYLTSEDDYIPIKAALNNLAYLDLMFRTEGEDYTFLKNYVAFLFADKYIEGGFIPNGNEVYFEALIRDELITWMCLYEYGTCVADAQDEFSAWMDATNPENNPIPVDIKSPVYETAIRNGGQVEWDFLYEQFAACEVGGERSRMMYGLGATVEVAIINSYLDLTIDASSAIRKQDVSSVYRALGRSNIGRITQFDWLKDNYESIKTYFGSTFSSTVNEIVSAYSDGGKTQAEIDALQEFYDANIGDLAGSMNTILQSQDAIRVNMNWNEANYQTVFEWLDVFDPDNTLPPDQTQPPSGETTTTQPPSGETTTTQPPSGETTTTGGVGNASLQMYVAIAAMGSFAVSRTL